MKANVRVSFGLRASMAYLPLVPVSVSMLVPLTAILAPGRGLPSLAEVTVPVTCTGGACPQACWTKTRDRRVATQRTTLAPSCPREKLPLMENLGGGGCLIITGV